MSSLLASDNNLRLDSADNALDVLSSGLPGCVFCPTDVHADFFELKNGLAGDVFQKFVNYNFRVAFVIPEQHGYGTRITELIRDHQNHPCIRFFTSTEDATAWLT